MSGKESNRRYPVCWSTTISW